MVKEKCLLNKLAKELNVESTVKFLSFNQNTYTYIKSLDLFVVYLNLRDFYY